MGLVTGAISNAMAFLPNHPGSWGGLPDFGVTEALAGKASGGQTRDLSSAVLGASSPGQKTNAQGSLPSFSSTNQNPSGNSISIVGGGNNSGGQSIRQQMEQGKIPWDDNLLAQLNNANRDINAEIENAFNAQMGFLNQAEGNIRGQMPGIEQNIQSQYGESVGTLDTNRTANLRDIATQEQGGVKRKEDAVTAARRLYNDLITGGQQRFGGASSAGEAFQALSGRELQRNRAQIEQNFSGFMQQIETAKTTLNERYTAGLQALEGQKNRALDDARREFQNRLLEIDRLRAGAVEDKANQRLSALQSLRNQTFQVNLAIAQMKASIDQQKQAADSEIESALSAFAQQNQFASDANTGFGENTATQYSSGLTFGDQGGSYDQPQMIGMANPDEEYMVGSMTPPRRDQFSFA